MLDKREKEKNLHFQISLVHALRVVLWQGVGEIERRAVQEKIYIK